MSEWGFVGAAYGVTWAVLAAYARYVRARARRAETELERAREGREAAR